MKLEKQLCSRELSIQLKKMGIKQNGVFTHVDFAIGRSVLQQTVALKSYLEDLKKVRFDVIADAFTVAELGEIIKEVLDDSIIEDLFFVNTKPTLIREGIDTVVADTEADCRAKLVILLKQREEGLMNDY